MIVIWPEAALTAKRNREVQSLGLLRTLISEMLAEDKRDMEIAGKVDHDQLRDFARFIKAAELAENHGLRMRVSLLPLGHTDFGIYTIFPHCPFCKARARTEKWQRKYPTARQKCSVCGTEFSPAETASEKRMKRERDELRQVYIGVVSPGDVAERNESAHKGRLLSGLSF